MLITLDGLRPDAIAAAPAPTLAALAAAGAATNAARAATPTQTMANLFAMATGRAPAAHGVAGDLPPPTPIAVPTIFTAVQAAGGRSALYFGKHKLTWLTTNGAVDVMRGPRARNQDWPAGAAQSLADAFATDFPRERFMLSWLHLRDPDTAGHKYGWMSAQYLEAVRRTDDAVATILRAVDHTGRTGTTAVLVTSDHGGHGKDHSAGMLENALIPMLCRGPGVAAGAAIAAAGNADIAPTVMALLALPPLPHADGQPIRECLP